MTAMESEFADAGDRGEFSGRLFRGYLTLSALNVLAALLYLAVVLAHVLTTSEPTEGPLDLSPANITILAAPIVLLLGAYIPLLIAGSRRVAALRSGADHARRAAHRLSYGFAAASAYTVFWVFTMFHAGEDGLGIDGAVWERFGWVADNDLNLFGWLGLGTVLVAIVLFVGALAVAVVTRPLRGERG